MPTCPKGYHQVTKVALSFQQSVVNTSTIKSMLTSSPALLVSGCIRRKGVIAPNLWLPTQNLTEDLSRTKIMERNFSLVLLLLSLHLCDRFSLIWFIILAWSTLLTQLSCWAAITWPRTEFFSEFQKTKHVEPRALFHKKASKPSRNESWLGYISCQFIICFQLGLHVESSKP